MADFPFNPIHSAIRLGTSASATNTTLALDSAFTFGSAGDAVSFDFVAREAATLTDLYFFVTAIAGTLGNIQCTIQLRDDSSGSAGSTVHASTTCAVNGATTWARATFGTPYTLVLGTRYHVIVYNSSGAPTTDYPTVLRISSRFPNIDGNDLVARQSTNGGTTWSGGTTSQMVGVLKFGNGHVLGQPYTSVNTNYTSNTRERGYYIPTRGVNLNLLDLRVPSLTNISGAKLILSTTAPGATPGAGEEAGALSALLVGAVFTSSAVALATLAYRVVLTFSGSTVNPAFAQIDDYARYTDVQAAGLPIYGTIDDGAGGWTDSPAVMPLIALGLRAVGAEDAAPSGGGYSRGRITNA